MYSSNFLTHSNVRLNSKFLLWADEWMLTNFLATSTSDITGFTTSFFVGSLTSGLTTSLTSVNSSLVTSWEGSVVFFFVILISIF